MVDLPHQIGPCQLVELGALVAIRCPSDLDGILRRAGATREPGSLSCHPRVRPSWSRSSAAAPIRCSGGQVSIWTTARTTIRSLAVVPGGASHARRLTSSSSAPRTRSLALPRSTPVAAGLLVLPGSTHAGHRRRPTEDMGMDNDAEMSAEIPRQIARAASVSASPSGRPTACSVNSRAIVRAMAMN